MVGESQAIDYAVYLEIFRGSCAPSSYLLVTYGLVMIALYLLISAAGANENCGSKTARKTFISKIEKRQPRHACGPNEKDMMFANPGCCAGTPPGVPLGIVQRSGRNERASGPQRSLL